MASVESKRHSRRNTVSTKKHRRSVVSEFTNKVTEIDEPTILNLTNYKKDDPNFNAAIYANFNEFYKQINTQLDTEIKQNKGFIIQAFSIKDEFRKELKSIEDSYNDMYLKPIKPEEFYDGKYPQFLKHMFNKSYKVYEKYEEELGLPNDKYENPVRIEDQTDEQIFETLKLRIDGLKQCQISPQTSIDEKKYYEIEYERELDSYNKLASDDTISFAEKVAKQCKNIFYNLDSLEKYQSSITKDSNETYITRLKKFFYDNPDEELYARTFLPESCFDNVDGKFTINFDKVKELLKSGDRDFRQFVFGFYSDSILDNIRQLKPFLYEAGGMIYKDNYNSSCNQLVNWSLFLNMLYCRCGVSNTEPLCPARFNITLRSSLSTSLSRKSITKQNTTKNTNESFHKTVQDGYETITFDIRDKLPLTDIFDGEPDTNAEFMGIIAIKYYHEETNEVRIWYFFVFKNNDLTNSSRQNTNTGVRDKVILCNYRLRQINMFALFEKHNVTHYELLHYINLANKKTPGSRTLYFYKSLSTYHQDKQNKTETIFISRRDDLEKIPFLTDLQLTKVEIKMKDIPGNYHTIPKTNISIKYNTINPEKLSMINALHSGGNNLLPIKIKTTFDEKKLYFSYLVLSKNYINFLDSLEAVENIGWYNDDIDKNFISPDREKIYKYLKNTYPYLLVDARDSSFKYKTNSKYDNTDNTDKYVNKNYIIPKYKPLGTDFFIINELFQKHKLFNLLNNKTSLDNSILYVGSSLSLLEYLSYSKYNFTSITNILTLSHNYYANLVDEWSKYINNVSSIYKVNNINYNDSIYNIINPPNLASNITKTNNIVYWNVTRIINGVGKYNSYYNIPIYISGILFSLQHLITGGTLVFTIENVIYKHTADIILIIAQYFEEWHFFYPELYNKYKRNGVFIIFKNFKGITAKDVEYLQNLLDKVKHIYDNDANDFNIHNLELRKKIHISRQPIPKEPNQNIISFLDYDIDNKIYDTFRLFNDSRYMEQLIYITKMINALSSSDRDKYLDMKLPTSDQITASILYCKKYDIPYFDKYNTFKMDAFISKNILSEMYGLNEPILYKFKTPFKTYISDKIILNPKLDHLSRKHDSILKTIQSSSRSSFKKIRKTKKHVKTVTSRVLSRRDTIGKLFRDLFSSNKQSTRHSYDKSHKSINSTRKNRSVLKRSNISLLNTIFPSNNQIIQVGRLIDSRRDFTKSISKYDSQTWLYDELKELFRYYKGKGNKRNVDNLDIMVQEKLGDKSISQAWLKMYEIISECELVPTTQKGTFHSFHICEAPGTFINCINNYIRTKTQYSNYEWHSQSLNPKLKLARIKDQFGLIDRHLERWDYGADKTGDITQVKNIKYYKQQVAKRPPIQLMTSDCGLEWGNPKYELVAFASYVAILNILPVGGTMLYKIMSPIDLPLLWNLIYITFTNFKDMYFFKPVQNSQSREFYIVAKNYLGTDQKVLDKLLDIVDKWSKLEKSDYKAKWIEELDLFGDQYPEEFVAQVITISERLSQNYVNSIERIIYYMDNNDILGDDYKKHIEKYIREKNEDWIRKYKPRKIDNKSIL